MTSDPQVTLCIPTYQSETFIERTLGHASAQSHRNLRVLVSIDQSTDATEEICRRYAAADSRFEVYAHESRMGWAHNLNFLLDKVESEFFCIYFHDDLIDPRYLELLLAELISRPDAASSQADTLHVDPRGRQRRSSGRAQEGSDFDRVVAALADPFVGSPLRALIRTALAKPDVRFPAASVQGFGGHIPFTAALLAAGPVLHVPEILYWRPDKRKGGLVDGWKKTPIRDLVSDHRINAREILETIDRCEATEAERTVMRFVAALHLMSVLRQRETGAGERTLVAATEISSAFEIDTPPDELREISARQRRLILAAHVDLVRRELVHHLSHRAVRAAMDVANDIGWMDALVGVPELGRQYLGVLRQRYLPSQIPAELRTWELVG